MSRKLNVLRIVTNHQMIRDSQEEKKVNPTLVDLLVTDATTYLIDLTSH
jgi:hypothetical protein